MDPQQRLLLERGYEAVHGGRWRRCVLLDGDTGVLLGIERPDWATVQALAPRRSSVYDVTSSTISIACGRLSFALGESSVAGEESWLLLLPVEASPPWRTVAAATGDCVPEDTVGPGAVDEEGATAFF